MLQPGGSKRVEHDELNNNNKQKDIENYPNISKLNDSLLNDVFVNF